MSKKFKIQRTVRSKGEVRGSIGTPEPLCTITSGGKDLTKIPGIPDTNQRVETLSSINTGFYDDNEFDREDVDSYIDEGDYGEVPEDYRGDGIGNYGVELEEGLDGSEEHQPTNPLAGHYGQVGQYIADIVDSTTQAYIENLTIAVYEGELSLDDYFESLNRTMNTFGTIRDVLNG